MYSIIFLKTQNFTFQKKGRDKTNMVRFKKFMLHICTKYLRNAEDTVWILLDLATTLQLACLEGS